MQQKKQGQGKRKEKDILYTRLRKSIELKERKKKKERYVKTTRLADLVSPYRLVEMLSNGEDERERRREKEKECTVEGERGIYRKWYNIAAGKDAESGPQLHRPMLRLLSFPLVRLAPRTRLHIYSRFRNNNYLILEARAHATGEMRVPAVRKRGERE